MDLENLDDKNLLVEYHKHNLVYIGDYIKFADAKAGVAISANLIALGFFGNIIKDNNYSVTSLSEIYLIIGVLILASASFIFGKVLWPRYLLDKEYYMSWGGIAAFGNSEEYINQIHGQSNQEFLKSMAEQNRALALVCAKKYEYLRIGFELLAIGITLSSLSWLFA